MIFHSDPFHVQVSFASRLGPFLERFKKVGRNHWNFRCPYCGDSQKSQSKARGYIYETKASLWFRCWNCGVGRRFGNFLREQVPLFYQDYSLECIKDRKNVVEVTTTEPEVVQEAPKILEAYTPLNELPYNHPAVVYVKGRCLPDSALARLGWHDSFKDYGRKNTWNLEAFEDKHAKMPEDEQRLIIPLHSRSGEVVACQGRSLDPNMKLRYVHYRFREDATRIFGLDKHNKDKTTLIFEGAMDSLFVPNALAGSGSVMDDLSLEVKKEKSIVVFDNEPRNKEIHKLMEKIIYQGWRIALWKEVPSDLKDFNDMVKAKYSIKDLLQMIARNTYSGLRASVEFDKWRKI